MNKVASVTFIWNHEPFIIPHFNMISNLDHNFVFMGNKPMNSYIGEHGISSEPDNSKLLINQHFPHVEIHDNTWYEECNFEAYNRIKEYVKDYDVVLRLDPDMLFTDKNWTQLINFLRTYKNDCFNLNFGKNTVNYYMDFDHGLQDALEMDVIAYKPDKLFIAPLQYPAKNRYIISWNGFICHHFRGWNKPRSITREWPITTYAKESFQLYSNNGDWFHCPEEIKAKFDHDTAYKWLGRFHT